MNSPKDQLLETLALMLMEVEIQTLGPMDDETMTQLNSRLKEVGHMAFAHPEKFKEMNRRLEAMTPAEKKELYLIKTSQIPPSTFGVN